MLVLLFLDLKGSMASTMPTPSFTFPKPTFAVQIRGVGSADGKLGTIGVWLSICHERDARTVLSRMKFSSTNFSS